MSDDDEMKDEVVQSFHVGMLLRCFLCHERLPRSNNLEQGEPYPEWQGSLVSGTF